MAQAPSEANQSSSRKQKLTRNQRRRLAKQRRLQAEATQQQQQSQQSSQPSSTINPDQFPSRTIKIEIITDDATALNAVNDLCNERFIGFDCEGAGNLDREHDVSLIQLSTYSTVYIIDLVAMNNRLPQCIVDFLSSKPPASVNDDWKDGAYKCIHDVRSDQDALFHVYGIELHGVFDTTIAYLVGANKLGKKIDFLTGMNAVSEIMLKNHINSTMKFQIYKNIKDIGKEIVGNKISIKTVNLNDKIKNSESNKNTQNNNTKKQATRGKLNKPNKLNTPNKANKANNPNNQNVKLNHRVEKKSKENSVKNDNVHEGKEEGKTEGKNQNDSESRSNKKNDNSVLEEETKQMSEAKNDENKENANETSNNNENNNENENENETALDGISKKKKKRRKQKKKKNGNCGSNNDNSNNNNKKHKNNMVLVSKIEIEVFDPALKNATKRLMTNDEDFWKNRPLTNESIIYASIDAYISLLIGQRFVKSSNKETKEKILEISDFWGKMNASLADTRAGSSYVPKIIQKMINPKKFGKCNKKKIDLPLEFAKNVALKEQYIAFEREGM